LTDSETKLKRLFQIFEVQRASSFSGRGKKSSRENISKNMVKQTFKYAIVYFSFYMVEMPVGVVSLPKTIRLKIQILAGLEG